MPTMHGGSFLKVSTRASRLILRRKAILPSASKPTMWKTSLADIDADRRERGTGSIHGSFSGLRQSSLGRLLCTGSSRSIRLSDIDSHSPKPDGAWASVKHRRQFRGYRNGVPAVERNQARSDRLRSSQAPMPSVGSRTANASRKWGKTPAMAKGTSTKGTSTTLSNTLAATIRLPPERPPNK